MRDDLIELTLRNRDGSKKTQKDRLTMLLRMESDLRPYYPTRELKASELSGRMAQRLLKIWDAQGVSVATRKNRMSVLRWWAEKIGKQGMIRTNAENGLGRRVYITNRDKSLPVPTEDVYAKLSPHVRASVRLQNAFGFRRKTSILFNPSWALSGSTPETAEKIRIKGSWMKGNHPMSIEVTTREQREALRQALDLAGGGSLVPAGKNYAQQRNAFERETHAAGIGHTHGFRHGFAQREYEKRAGMECRAKAGTRRHLAGEEREKDRAARRQVSEYRGHHRVSVTANYLGSTGQ
jgi:hypothetical protein